MQLMRITKINYRLLTGARKRKPPGRGNYQNRIRRNLEGFRPYTMSKNKDKCNDIFRLIMGFPSPKLRNVEKDIKIFP